MDGLNFSEQTPKVKAGYLESAVARKRRELSRRVLRHSISDLRARALSARPARPWAESLRGPGVAVIAEIKRRSPSAGALEPDGDPVARARLYVEHGAAVVSVLTDRDFGGRLADLERVGAAVDRPVLRKDFLVDPWQVWESRAAGADVALLVLAAVEDGTAGAITRAAREAGMGLLVEIHDPSEIRRALGVDPEVIGVNARDLRTLHVDREAAVRTLGALRREVGEGVALVAESGIAGAPDLRRAREAGADAVLVGEALMRASDPGALLDELVAGGGP